MTIWTLGLSGCEDGKPRTYSEVVFKPLATGKGSGSMGNMPATGMPPLNASPVDIKVTWELPEGWLMKDSANSMRIGSFAAMDPALANMGSVDPYAVDVSIVQLAGDGGGIESNIRRWMGQIGLKASPEEMTELIKSSETFKTLSGQTGMYVDLTDKLSGDMTQDKTIFGAVVQTEDYTVFVKAMGERDRVLVQRPIIIRFCRTLKIESPNP